MDISVTYFVKSGRIRVLLNRALQEGITFLKIEHEEAETTFSLRRSDASAFERLLREEGFAFKVDGFRDGAALLKRVLSRPFLLASVLLTFVALLLFGGFVYGYSVSGNDRVNRSAVAAVLLENGVDGFTPKSHLDLAKIKKELVAIDGVAFASVRLVGTRLYVEIKEELPRVEPDPLFTEPITSDFDAVITKVVAESGTPRVKTGDVVQKGTVLIDPVYSFTEGEGAAYARGEVTGRVVYRKECVLPSSTIELLPTGRSSSCRILYLYGKRVGVEPVSPYPHFESKDRVVYRASGVLVVERTFYECREAPVYHDFDAEGAAVLSRLREEMLLSVPFYSNEKGGVYATQKRVDNTLVTVLYYTVEQRIDSSILEPRSGVEVYG